MEFASFDGKDDGEYSAGSFVKIFWIFDKIAQIFLRNDDI